MTPATRNRAKDMATYRFTLLVSMTHGEEDTYRTEHALGDRESTRSSLASHIQDQLDGEGVLTGR